MRPVGFRIFSLLIGFILLLPSAEAVYRIGKRATPDDVLKEEDLPQRLEQLRAGHLFAKGGYSAGGVWAKMEVVIQAPPALVWKLFTSSNDWNSYGVPFLLDTRAVNRDIAELVQESDDVQDVYGAIGTRTFDPYEKRRAGEKWPSYVFQFVDVKWPLDDRWVISFNKHDEGRASQGIYAMEWEKVAGDVRIYRGEMILRPFDGNPQMTRLVYVIDIHPGSFVPRFLLKGVVTHSFPDAIHAIRRAARREQAR